MVVITFVGRHFAVPEKYADLWTAQRLHGEVLLSARILREAQYRFPLRLDTKFLSPIRFSEQLRELYKILKFLWWRSWRSYTTIKISQGGQLKSNNSVLNFWASSEISG